MEFSWSSRDLYNCSLAFTFTPKVFPPFRLDPANQCLWREDVRIPMAPKAFDVLRYLVENAGRLVTQQELLSALWPETYVQPEILRKYILEIRKVLQDPPKHPMYIETFPKRGYQFIAPVRAEIAAAQAPAPDLAPRLVGREAPLNELAKRMKAASGGHRQVVFITGEGGIGKTTLLDAFEQQVMRSANIRIARGQCVEGFGGKETYYPVLEAFGHLIRGSGGERLVQLLAAHAPTWLIQFPYAVKADRKDALHQEILGATRERMVREFCEALERLSIDEPLVLILEDLQWADDSTLDLISAIARRRGPARLMLLSTYRPVDVILSRSPLKELKQDLLVHRLCHEMSLERLTESQVARFVANEFPENHLPGELISLIHRRSDGNPMFMVTMVDEMRDKLVAEGGRALAVPLEKLDPGVPQTLQQMLEFQVERLGAREQKLLRAASVAGQKFLAWAVAAMLEKNAGEVEEVCENLAVRQQFLKRAGAQVLPDQSESPQYEFKHALYREVLYRQLSSTQRRQLHLRLAERMEALSASGAAALASELALHFEEGRDYARAVPYLILTAASARRRYAHEDSVRCLRHALELLAHVRPEIAKDLKVQILERISDALYAQGEMLQSAEVDQAVVEHAGQSGMVVAQVDALTRLARALAFMDPDRCIAVCERAAEVSRGQDDPLLQARAEMLAGCWRMLTHGWRKEDARICAEARETIRGNDVVPAYYEILYAHVQYIQGDYEGAYQTANSGIPKAVENDNLVVYLSAHSSLAQALLQLGRLGELLQVLSTALDVSEKNRNAPWIGIFRATLTWVRLRCGDIEGARRQAEELAHEHVGEPAGQIRTMAAITIAFADLAAGSLDAALERFAGVTGREVHRHFFLDWYWRMVAQRGLSEACLAKGDLDRANHEADAFLQSAMSAADPGLKALAWELRARLAMAEAQPDRAREALSNAFAAFTEFEVPLVAWEIHATACDCFRLAGDSQTAEEHRTRAAAIVRELIRSLPEGEPLRESLRASAAGRGIRGD